MHPSNQTVMPTAQAICAPAIQPPGDHPPLYIPRRSRHVPAEDWHDVPGAIKDEWHEIAADKGFAIDRRVRDRYHLALECESCGAQVAQKLYTLRTAAVACTACQDKKLRDTAEAAGLTYLRSDPDDRHYACYRAACGHELRRQTGFVERIARGEVEARCETCQEARERTEAEARGWIWVGSDPKGDPNYRIYRHSCGHTQRIARANMQSGQCDCGSCGESWSARQSWIYLFDIRHDGDHVIKLGYSNDPIRRHRYQLGIPKGAKVAVLRQIPIPSGSMACSREKLMHSALRKRLPDAVVPQEEYSHLLNVVSEVYRPWARGRIEGLLDALEEDLAAHSAARA